MTCGASPPGMPSRWSSGGYQPTRRRRDPVATTTASGRRSSTEAAVAAAASSTVTPRSRSRPSRHATTSAYLGPALHPGDEVELTAEPIGLFDQRHIVAPLGGDDGGPRGRPGPRRPRDPAGPLGRAERADAPLGLPPDGRVLLARDRAAGDVAGQASLAGADADADGAGAAVARLVGQLRVGDRRTGHADEIDVLPGEDLLGVLGVDHATDPEHRQVADGVSPPPPTGSSSRVRTRCSRCRASRSR